MPRNKVQYLLSAFSAGVQQPTYPPATYRNCTAVGLRPIHFLRASSRLHPTFFAKCVSNEAYKASTSRSIYLRAHHTLQFTVVQLLSRQYVHAPLALAAYPLIEIISSWYSELYDKVIYGLDLSRARRRQGHARTVHHKN